MEVAKKENIENFNFQLRLGAMKKKIERSDTLSLRECGIGNENTISVFPCGGLLGGSGKGVPKRGADQMVDEKAEEPAAKIGSTTVKKLTKRSTGNDTTLYQAKGLRKQLQEQKKLRKLNVFKSFTKITEDEIPILLNRLTNCCEKHRKINGGYGGCLLSEFKVYDHTLKRAITDINAVNKYVLQVREMVWNKNTEEFDNFMIEQFRDSVTGRNKLGIDEDGNIRYGNNLTHSWQLPRRNDSPGSGRLVVCRATFLLLFGTTQHHMGKIRKKLLSRTNEYEPLLASARSSNHTSYKDDTLHDITYARTEQIMEENLVNAEFMSSEGTAMVDYFLFSFLTPRCFVFLFIPCSSQ